MEEKLTTVKTRKQQELIEIGKVAIEANIYKSTWTKNYTGWTSGANLERQYEDRVQKMLSELREVGTYSNSKSGSPLPSWGTWPELADHSLKINHVGGVGLPSVRGRDNEEKKSNK